MKKILACWLPYQEKILLWWIPLQARALTELKPRIEKAMKRWQGLSFHEQATLLAGSCLSAGLLLYAVLWSPLTEHLQTLRTQVIQEKKTLAWMMAADRKLRSLENRPQTLKEESLLSQINALQEKIKQGPLSLHLTQLAQVSANEIHCTFDPVEFDPLITWLTQFSGQENFTIEQAAIRKLNNVGLVQADFIFQLK